MVLEILLKIAHVEAPQRVNFLVSSAGVRKGWFSNDQVDQHLYKRRELHELIRPNNLIITGGADVLGIEAAKLDHSIWRHMSERGSAV